jgi:hypothetical protein
VPPQPVSSSSVRYWSDYNRVFFHPRSIAPLSENQFTTDSTAIADWTTGYQTFKEMENRAEIIDRDWRPFIEECDRMQGIQMITSTVDGWGGFASAYGEYLHDEYGKCCIWTWGLGALDYCDSSLSERRVQMATTVSSLASLCSTSNTFVPLSLPSRCPNDIDMTQPSLWKSSALLATGLETATLLSRVLKNSGLVTTLDELSRNLNTFASYPLAQLSLNVNPSADAASYIRGAGQHVIDRGLGWMDMSPISPMWATRSTSRMGHSSGPAKPKHAIVVRRSNFLSSNVECGDEEGARFVRYERYHAISKN